MKLHLTTSLLIAVSTARAFVVPACKKAVATAAFMSNEAFYSLTATAGDGSKVSMSDLKGKVVYATNEFGGQEFGSDQEIAAFAASQGFPSNGILLQLGSVVGDSAPQVWKHLREATGSSDPGWNFDSKYLVSKTGEVSVPSSDVEGDIEKLLGE